MGHSRSWTAGSIVERGPVAGQSFTKALQTRSYSPLTGPVTVDSLFSKAWLVGRSGSLTAGIQYNQSPPGRGPVAAKGVPAELKDFNLALGYGTPGRGPLQPSFDFVLELIQGSKVGSD